MKTKLYAFLLATLTSVSVFATRNVVPSDAVLADYYDNGNVCVCIFVPEELACNDIVLTGSFNNWSGTAANCVPFEAIEGYDGWYVASFEPEAEPDAEKGIQAKPVMLDVDGNFNWEYQIGATTTIRGGVQVVAGFSGEIDLINYGADAPNVFTVDAWKNNPCTLIFHNYTVTVINDGCGGYVVPFIIGAMTRWDFEQMQLDVAKTQEYQTPVYYYSFKAAESTPYQIVSGLMDDQGVVPVSGDSAVGWKNIAYMQMLVNGVWRRIPGEDGDNQLTHENANIVWDLRAENLRWARCSTCSLNVNCDSTKGSVTGSGQYDMSSQVTFSAIPNYGYHFVRWNDDNTSNPRTITITADKTYTAIFAKNTYFITKVSDYEQGLISGSSQAEYLDEVTLTANPKYGYYFTQWSDGETENPRTFTITQDTTFMAEFAKNTYSITTESSNNTWGTTVGDTSALYLEQVEISATVLQYGYHFVRWDDNNTSNPRTITITEDKTYTAIFAKNIYFITKISDYEQGLISGSSQAEYLDEVTLTANPEYGYHFTQWSDGETDNPRTFTITQDTTFMAEFAIDKSGTCGNDNLLMWRFDENSSTLVISGNGLLNSNYTFGAEAPIHTERLIIEEGVTSIGNNAFSNMTSSITSLALPSTVTFIGDYAFAGLNNRKFNTLVLPNNIISIGAHAFDGTSYLQTIYFGSALEEIGAYAFNGCTRVKQMTCLAEVTPNVGTDGLASISNLAKLYVPNDYLFDYQIDNNWNRFSLQPLGAAETTVTDNNVTVESDDNSVVITWPINANAATYTIVITKDDEIVCTLTFNADGQLTGIAFAPGRNGTPRYATAAKKVENSGMQFTVTGLNSNTNYSYSVVAKDAQEDVVASYEGDFATTGDIPTSIGDVSTGSVTCTKLLRDGQILILRGKKVYTLQGQEVR